MPEEIDADGTDADHEVVNLLTQRDIHPRTRLLRQAEQGPRQETSTMPAWIETKTASHTLRPARTAPSAVRSGTGAGDKESSGKSPYGARSPKHVISTIVQT